MMDDYRPASLSKEQLDELRRAEEQLRSASNQNIILIAYEQESDKS